MPRRAIRLVSSLAFLVAASAFAQTATIPAHSTAPYTDQDVLLLFAGESANDRILLTLNNNRADSLTAEMTLYDVGGTAIPLPSVTLVKSESRLIELSQTLLASHIYVPLGYLKVHYSGRSMELGSQLTLYPLESHGGLDSPRSLSVDFASTERHAVAWVPPGSTSVVAITNVTA